MCRWIAYHGEIVTLERYVTEPPRSLVIHSMRARESQFPVNGDGFGIGWYTNLPEPGLYREVRPAWSDDNLRHLCRHIDSHLFFAHIRAATGTPVMRPNCHPFASGAWMFMHNGYVGDWMELKREVEALIPDDLYAQRAGSTDSEAVFLAMMGAGAAANPIGATESTLSAINRLLVEGGKEPSMRFTAALSDGQTLYAFRYAFNDNANTLYYWSMDRSIVVASEPLDEEISHWRAVPENHVLVVKPDGAFDIRPLQIS